MGKAVATGAGRGFAVKEIRSSRPHEVEEIAVLVALDLSAVFDPVLLS